MKQQVVHFKNLKLALKELQPFILDGCHLQTGRPFNQLDGLRSREAFANWLLCVATGPDQLDFTSDPQGGDGIIIDKWTGETWQTEHILISNGSDKTNPEELITAAVLKKQNKGGKAYANGKTLVVFMNADNGAWSPTSTAKKLPDELDFEAVWVVCLQGIVDGAYTYAVTRLDLSQGHPPVWKVHINSDFNSWRVE